MNYTFSPETSEKLIKLGIRRHFPIQYNTCSVFDLMIPENAKKIWKGKAVDGAIFSQELWVNKQYELLTLIQQGQSIESIEEWLK